MGDPSIGSDRPLYVYILILGNLIGVAGMAFLLLGVLGALGLITAVTDSLGGLGSSFASATTGSAAKFSFAFLASLVSLAASWKIFREGERRWLLGLVVVFQVAAAAIFHSWVSVIALIPTLAAIYGLARALGAGWAPAVAGEPNRSRSGAAPASPLRTAVPSQAAYSTAAPGRGADGRVGATTPGAATTPAAAAAAPTAPSAAAPRAAPAAPEHAATPRKEEEPSPAPVAGTTRRCANCGAANAEAARFCNTCGSILPGQA